jgi:hypothetical protein
MAFVTVTGEVTRTFYNGKGAEITEKFTVKDKEIKKRFTAWFESEHGLTEGQIVEVSGIHGDEVDEWTDRENNIRHSVKRSINKAKVKGSEQRQSQPAAAESWSAAPYNDETPF